QADMLGFDITSEPFSTPEAADADLARHIAGNLAEPRKAINIAGAHPARDLHCVAGAPEKQDAHHRATPTNRPSRSIANTSTATSGGTMARATSRAWRQTASPNATPCAVAVASACCLVFAARISACKASLP